MRKLAVYASLASLTAVLVACPQSVTPPAGGGGISSISGTVSGWTSGAGIIELLASPYNDKSATNPALSRGVINADGTFSVALPSAAVVTPYLSAIAGSFSSGSSCSGGFTSSAAGALGLVTDLLDVRQNGVYTTSIEPYTSTDQSAGNTVTVVSTSKLWVYVNTPTTLSGQINCTTTSSGITFSVRLNANAPLNQGWNVLGQSLTTTGTVNSGTATTTGTITVASDGSIPWKTFNLAAASLSLSAGHVDKGSALQIAAADFARAANR
ncbi:hypothetical protein [Deinococcus sp.]|uniref:hypothetical protein n=1 Tax=Deinococcus sp. TaxID=47478 RepID=UPI003CC6427E